MCFRNALIFMGRCLCMGGAVLFLISGISYPIPADQGDRFDPYRIDQLPGGFFFTTYLENYAPDSVLSVEESNGFAYLDNPLVYFEGDPFNQFKWNYEGFNINSPLNHGASALRFPFTSLSGFRLRGESPLTRDHGFSFLSDLPAGDYSRVMASAIYSDLGGYSEWLGFMINSPAYERDDYLYSERRKTLSNFFFDYLFQKNLADSTLTVSLDYFDQNRQFNDFNVYDQTYEESGRLFSINSSWRKPLKNGTLSAHAVFNYLSRDSLTGESGRYPQETVANESLTFFAAFALKKRAFELRASFLSENETRTTSFPEFTKDLMDNDGEGFLTFPRLGDFSGNVATLDLRVPAFKGGEGGGRFQLEGFADLRYAALRGDETTSGDHPLLFNDDSYLVYRWSAGDPYTNANLAARLGFLVSWELAPPVTLVSKFWLDYGALSFENKDNNLGFTTPAFDVGLQLFKQSNFQVLLSYGHIPYSLGEEVNFFLESRRASADIHFWSDANGDGRFQEGEDGALYGHSGGAYHFVDQNIRRPIKERFLVELSTRLSDKWHLQVKGIYKNIRNDLWVSFAREFGFYENRGGHDLYFFDQPFRDFSLTNESFEEDPFYAQLVFHLKGEEANRWFFSLSFMAHIGMGHTAFGNGPGTNDIGVLSESQADPNSWINGYGRLDGDRAFVGRIYFGFHLMRNLSLAVGLKYRDGNPFAFIESENAHDQWVLYYQTIKAEDERGVKGGPREDYLSDVSVQMNYSFRLFDRDARLSLAFFNLLDVGYELSEYVFSGGSRDAMELAIPRSLRLTFSIRI